jgi:zinc protease
MPLTRLFAALMALLCAGVGAQGVSPVPMAADSTAALPALQVVNRVEGITEYRLPNGLQVLLVPDDSKPTTTVNLTYRVGSRHENYGETGMAHLLEHLLFKGTPTTPEVWAEFTRRGMRPNGSTSFDRTNYFASFAANDDTLRWYLGWQADAMVNSFIARKDLDTEMTVVRNEFEAGENNPGRVLLQQTMGAVYHWHNYGKSTIGARTDIENVDIPRLQAFYRLHYQPDNATLTVAGKFKPEQVLAWVVQSFGPLPRPTRVLAPTYTLDPPQDGEHQVTVRRIGGTPAVDMAYPTLPGSHPDFAAVQMLALVLGDTPGGRLHKHLVEKKLAAQAFAFAWSLAEPGPLILGLSLAPGQDIDRARTEMARVLDGLRTEPVTAQELERARTQWLNDWAQGYTDPERVGVALSEAIANGDWRLYFLQRDQVRRLTLADVNRVAATWLRPDNRSVGLYRPTTARNPPDRAPQSARVDVAALVQGYRGDAAEAAVEAFEATPSNIDSRTRLSALQGGSGLKIALLPKGTRGRSVQANLLLHFGDVNSLKGTEAVAAFAGGLFDKGGAGLTRQQIADTFDRLQSSVSFGISEQTLAVNITSKREHLPAVIELVGKLLRQPAYSQAGLQELRAQWLAGIEAQRKEPEAILANRLARHGNPYPRGDLRYAGTFDESEQDVKAVTLAQLNSFHRRFISAASGEFSAVGDLDPAAVQQALQQALGSWRQPAAGPQPYVRLPQPLVPAPPSRFVERTPDKANAVFKAQLALPLTDLSPDYAALSVANFIFGQGQDSRLWQRVRQKEGLSYGVGSSIAWSATDANSLFSLSAIFAPQNQARVEAAVTEELARSLKDGFTPAELEAARSGLLNARRLGRAQDGVVAGRLAANLELGRRFAVSQQVDDAIAALTRQQVNAAWRRYIDPQQLVLGWAGDFKP